MNDVNETMIAGIAPETVAASEPEAVTAVAAPAPRKAPRRRAARKVARKAPRKAAVKKTARQAAC